VTATLYNAPGEPMSTLFSEPKQAGDQSFTFTAAPGLLGGPYTIQLVAQANGKTVAATVPLVVDDTIDALTASPAAFSTAKGGAATLAFTLTRGPVTAELDVKQGDTIVSTKPSTTLDVGQQKLEWNGMLTDGTPAPDGAYTLALTVTTPFSTLTRTAQVTVDSTAPKVAALSYKNMRFRVSEPARLTLIVGTSRFSRTLKKPATTQFWLKVKPRAYRLVATDAAGNSTVLRYRASHRS
jgi:flagellar hook assembly protein FlgD